MSDLLVVEGREYRWLNDLLVRMSCGEEIGTNDDLDYAAGLVERSACCERCEGLYNQHILSKMGYEKKGGVSNAE